MGIVQGYEHLLQRFHFASPPGPLPSLALYLQSVHSMPIAGQSILC